MDKKIKKIKEPLKRLKLAEGTISTILGALVVIIIGVLLFNYFRNVDTKIAPDILEEGREFSLVENETQEGQQAVSLTPIEDLPATYKVQPGDHLWKISEKFYGSGYNWVDIASENNIADGNMLAVDLEINIPNVPVRAPKTVVAQAAGEETNAISNESYTVVAGDSLWKIAVRAYQDGYKWPEIAKANNIVNPGLIHPGNVLRLSR